MGLELDPKATAGQESPEADPKGLRVEGLALVDRVTGKRQEGDNSHPEIDPGGVVALAVHAGQAVFDQFHAGGNRAAT